MPASHRETFATRFGLVATMIGVAIGLGNVWRFPYMVGRFGGASFVAFYLLVVVTVGIPGLIAEWTLGRHTRRGPVGGFARAGLPAGRVLGWIFFVGVTAATAYYSAVIGWVGFHALAEAAALVGIGLDPSAILPPETGFSPRSFALQLGGTVGVVLACALVLVRGLRGGIEKASRILTPLLFATLLVLVARSLTLEGAGEGLAWFLGGFDPGALTGGVAVAAMGQAIFSLSLGGTFMVVYGSYLSEGDDLRADAVWTAFGDAAAGLLAGLAIFPAVFALGLEPAAGPELLFSTLPRVFAGMPAGAVFGLLFFGGLLGAAYLSAVAAFEVLVAGLVDNTSLSRRRAVGALAVAVVALSIPPTLNLRVFVPWDLAFGSGLQTMGSLLAVGAVGWSLDRAAALKELDDTRRDTVWLHRWLRWVVPAVILTVAIYWVLTDVTGAIGG